MRRLFFAIIAALLTVAAIPLALPALAQQVDDRLIALPGNDVEIRAAIKDARATLREFWKAHAKPGPSEDGFSLKVAISEGDKTEHIWLVNIERKGSKIAGTISNNPDWVKNLKFAQRYEFSEDHITDWTFRRKGKFVGNRTGRALMKHMPKDEAERFRQMFETP